jgi:hypothetical protein
VVKLEDTQQILRQVTAFLVGGLEAPSSRAG